MDSARKRKASTATPSTNDGAPPKKLKLLNSQSGGDSVKAKGFKFLNQLKQATDKAGRAIADAFLVLPDEDELPDYYETIKLPIALDIIESKLERDAYPTMITLESDVKRMIQNAKEYNATGSPVFEDAEKIRKLTYNFMKQNNPAYRDPSYSAFPTPIPDGKAVAKTNGVHVNGSSDKAVPSRGVSEVSSRKPAVIRLESTDRRSSQAPSNTATGEEFEGDDYSGLDFSKAQQKIVTDLINYRDEEGLQIYIPFNTLPSRELTDYYQLIRHPVSLKGVLKRTQGRHGRKEVTGVSDFKTWDAYEEEVSFIWRNAREYNEDGSEISELAATLEDDFKARLATAKEQVEGPSGPKLKIAGPKPKVTLNLSQHRSSPVPPSGVSVDNAALLRQKQMVAAGVNGRQSSQQAVPATKEVNGMTRTSSQASGSDLARPPTAGSPVPLAVKNEKASTQSPALASVAPAVQPVINGMMPPPSVRPPSNSPFVHPPPGNYHYTAPAALPPTSVRTYPVEQALLPNVLIATHPHLKITPPFKVNVGPHTALSQQSRTITLPNSHYFLQISPTISRQLAMGRAYKLFVTLNGTRLSQRDTQFHVETGRRTHVYEGSLAQGVNRIEIEAVAAPEEKDVEGETTTKGLDVEKVTVFANLMRA